MNKVIARQNNHKTRQSTTTRRNKKDNQQPQEETKKKKRQSTTTRRNKKKKKKTSTVAGIRLVYHLRLTKKCTRACDMTAKFPRTRQEQKPNPTRQG